MLVAGAVLLLIAILIGQRLGDRVISQGLARRVPLSGLVTTTPIPAPSGPLEANWKRAQVVSVATDPAFPDPRVTPPPTAKPTPAPTPVPTLTPAPTPTYSSPPLPLPIVSHPPGETETEAPASPAPSP
jgi:hypothetical protein